MPRISGVDIPADKQIGISLTYIKGIGHTLAGELLNKVGIGQTVKARDLTELLRLRTNMSSRVGFVVRFSRTSRV